MKLFQKLIAAPAIISMASGFAVNAAEINSTDLSDYSNSSNLVSLGDFKSDTLFPGDWAYDSLKDLTNSPKFNGNSVTRLEAAAELNNLIAGGEGLMNGAAIGRLSDELGSELAIIKGRVDGLEARVNGLEAGAFSETTSASFGVDAILEAMPYQLARWISDGWPAIEKLGRIFNCKIVKDCWNRPVILFKNEWNLNQFVEDNNQLNLNKVAPVVSGVEPIAL